VWPGRQRKRHPDAGGGTLIVGVKDNREIVGIEADYERLKERSKDGWRLCFDDLVSDSWVPR
jgi:predicted HTH transcriptional regulator